MQRIRLKREPRLDTKYEAFKFQAEAFRAVRDLEYAAIFHEQGLGKSKIAIDLMLYWLEYQVVDTVLFVVKKGLLHNWVREFKLHTYLKPKQLTQNRRHNYYVFNSPSRLILTHYEVLKAEKERFMLFLNTRNVAVILDESAKIKNPDASLTKAVFDLAPSFIKRIVMTGTPVANRPYDIWAQIWFLDQGDSLGDDFGEFKRQVDLTKDLSLDLEVQSEFEDQLSAIFPKISKFTVRDRKDSGVIELPAKKYERLYAEWEHYQFDLYQQIRNNLSAIIIKEGIPEIDRSEGLLKRIMRLVQIASNPKLVDESYSAVPGKYLPLLELISEICNRNEKCIVWTSFTANVDWLAKELHIYGSRRVHGKLAMEARNRSIEKFLSDKSINVLVATPGAAKEGLTLTVANHVIFFDRSFSLDDYLQAQDRIHRISQNKTCYIHNIVMPDSIDEWVDVLLNCKQLAAQLTQGDISLDYYRSQMHYSFTQVLQEVLNI